MPVNCCTGQAYVSNVEIKAIQEIIGAVKHYKGDQMMAVINGYYTSALMELVRTNNLELINILLEVNTENVEVDFDFR